MNRCEHQWEFIKMEKYREPEDLKLYEIAIFVCPKCDLIKRLVLDTDYKIQPTR